MNFILAGISYRNASLDLLGRVAVTSSALPSVLRELSHYVGECVVLSTCNRTELYASVENAEAGTARLLEFMERLVVRKDPGRVGVELPAYRLSGDDVVSHLMGVVAGADSMALGEHEIVRQVTDAFEIAVQERCVSRPLSRLFHHAFLFGRRARESTGIGHNSISLPSIGVKAIEQSIGGLNGRAALLIGAGQTGLLTARALAYRGIGRLSVSSRSAQRAHALSDELGGDSVPFNDFNEVLTNVDIVVTCTGSTVPIISSRTLSKIMDARGGRRLTVLDLAVPRDVEEPAADIPGIELITLEELRDISAHHRSDRAESARQVKRLVDVEVKRFKEREIKVDVEPVIRSLGSRAEMIRRREVERAMKQLGSIGRIEQGVIEAMSRAIVARLISDPITFLRTIDSDDEADTVARVFDLITVAEDE